MNLKEIKKVLMGGKGKILVSSHTRTRLNQRGYTKGDIVACIFNGNIAEYQGASKVAITGHDKDGNPVVVVIAKISESTFKVVTVMPPTDHYRFKDCV